jgi:hypothetical protein
MDDADDDEHHLIFLEGQAAALFRVWIPGIGFLANGYDIQNSKLDDPTMILKYDGLSLHNCLLSSPIL